MNSKKQKPELLDLSKNNKRTFKSLLMNNHLLDEPSSSLTGRTSTPTTPEKIVFCCGSVQQTTIRLGLILNSQLLGQQLLQVSRPIPQHCRIMIPRA